MSEGMSEEQDAENLAYERDNPTMTPLDAAREGKRLVDNPTYQYAHLDHADLYYGIICQALIDAVEALEKECSQFNFPDEDRPILHTALTAITKEKPDSKTI